MNHAEITLREVLAARPRRLAHGACTASPSSSSDGETKASPRLRKARRPRGDNPRAWADLAVALRDNGGLPAAEAIYARALAGQPPSANAPPLADQVFCTEVGAFDFTVVDYPYRAEIRYGAGRPAHPELVAIIGAGRDRYRTFLTGLGAAAGRISPTCRSAGPTTPWSPFWLNAWVSPLDAMALTGMLRAHDPARMVEIGSGVSTKYARRAIDLYGLKTRLVSIDPKPRNQIDHLCDQVIRQPLEHVQPCDLRDALEPGDVFFIDSSHRAFPGLRRHGHLPGDPAAPEAWRAGAHPRHLPA